MSAEPDQFKGQLLLLALHFALGVLGLDSATMRTQSSLALAGNLLLSAVLCSFLAVAWRTS